MKKLPALLTPLAVVLALLLVPIADGAGTTKLSITKVAASGQKVTVKGKVTLAGATNLARWRKTRVALSLTDGAGKVQRVTAKPDAKGRFAKTFTTALSGQLALRGRIKVGGRPAGKLVTENGAIVVGQATGGGAQKLSGLFKLDPGLDRADGSHSGTYFQMFSPKGPAMVNNSSPSKDNRFTPLPPGTDGGLRTDVYQEPPSPAFSGGNIGNALASRITKPQGFFSTDFSIVTTPLDLQTGTPDPLPEIVVDDNGQLSGQITAWTAQWNGNAFNQGTPKPDGKLPGTTTRLHGTYDKVSRRFVLEWNSLIVGGPFNAFTGHWHLEGTFVPAT
jgi:hypothetical protein